MATQVWLIMDATRRIHPQTAKTEPVYSNQFATAGRKPEAVRKVPPVLAAMLPIIAVVFIAFLVIGLTLPVLPLHVHQGLGLGTFVVGLVAGAQFGASLLYRFCLSRFGAGARQPCAGFDRERGRLGRGLPRQHPRRAVLRNDRCVALKCAIARYGKQESRILERQN